MRAKSARAHELKVEAVGIDRLEPAAYNPNRMTAGELEHLKASLRKFGVVDPIIANRRNGARRLTVVGGHQRLEAARALGHRTIPAVIVRLSDDDERLLNLALNMHGAPDLQALADLLKRLRDLEDLPVTGYDREAVDRTILEAERALAVSAQEAGEDELPPTPRKATTKAGELIELGPHRLLCGDSTDPEAVRRLMAGDRARMLVTDPPYLVDYTAGSAATAQLRGSRQRAQAAVDTEHAWDRFEGSEEAIAFFARFLEVALEEALVEAPAVYQWLASKRRVEVELAWRKAGLLVHQELIWIKQRAIITHCDFNFGHEPAVYGGRPGATPAIEPTTPRRAGTPPPRRAGKDGPAHCLDTGHATALYGWRQGDRPEVKPYSGTGTAWFIDNEVGLHPTQKPVELFARAILGSSRPGEITFEPFAGSGTAIIAAERTGRRCYALEREPIYCDVIRERYRRFLERRQEAADGGD